MSSSPIHFLRFLQKIKTNINVHYILKIKENFLVFTSKFIKGIKCHKITESNIKGESKPQYVAEVVNKYDTTLHKLTQTNECNTYYDKSKKELLFFEQKLKSIPESNE